MSKRRTKAKLIEQQKRATLFATLLQHELKGDVARFTTHIQLALQQIILLQKVASSSTATKSVHVARFTGLGASLSKVPVTFGPEIKFSNQNINNKTAGPG